MLTPDYGPGARIVLARDPANAGDFIAIVATQDRRDQVASSSESDPGFFRWLVTAAASHHALPLVDETDPSRPSITCPRCKRTSWHPEDIRTGYCGACHLFNPPIR